MTGEIQDNFANNEGTDSKVSEYPFFYSVPRITSMYCFSDAGAAHTAKSPLPNWQFHFARICEIKIGSTHIKHLYELRYPSHMSVPRKAVLRPAMQ